MARNGEAALKFTEDLHDRIVGAFEKDTEELQAWKAQQTGTDPGPMQPWEVSYWAEKRRKAEYDYDEEELRPYFPAAQRDGGHVWYRQQALQHPHRGARDGGGHRDLAPRVLFL